MNQNDDWVATVTAGAKRAKDANIDAIVEAAGYMSDVAEELGIDEAIATDAIDEVIEEKYGHFPETELGGLTVAEAEAKMRQDFLETVEKLKKDAK